MDKFFWGFVLVAAGFFALFVHALIVRVWGWAGFNVAACAGCLTLAVMNRGGGYRG